MADAGITKWNGKEVFKLATEANVKAMHTAALLVEREVKISFQKAGSGNAYKRGSKIHRASNKGETPAIDTGVLRASIMSSVQETPLGVVGKVGPDIGIIAADASAGTDVNYGLYLEMGTSKMAARPFLRPALAKSRRKIKQIFKAANK